MSDNKKFIKDLEDISLGFNKLDSASGTKIIEKSKYIDIASNKVSKTRLSKTDKDARDEARFRNTKLGQEFDESETPPEEMKRNVESLADKYMEDILDQIFKV